ncbi:hypothetical protein CspHIS471_0504990 [Cutaneotrichosporon sp. HIS471]|nr:hypothetical protein CspHIS471_0504990 [Cutaneotrichosporon sp. HIS471]
MAPLAPRNNLDALRNRVSSYTPTSLATTAKPAFQLARPPDLSGMKEGELVKVPPQSAPVRRPASRQPSPTTAATAPVSITSNTLQSSAPSPRYSAKLDQLPVEMIKAMLIKQMEDKMVLMEKRERLLEGDPDPDLIGEDADLIKAQINLLTSRIAEIKSAIAARGSHAPSSSNTSISHICTPTHPPRSHHVDPSITISQPLRPQPRLQPEAGPSRRMLVPESSPPPDIDERDIEMAEEGDWDEPPEDRPRTPPRRIAPLRKAASGVVVDRAAALAEFEDVDVHMLDSSPPRSPERPIRAEASVSRPVQRAAPTSSPMGPTPTQAPPPRPAPLSVVKPRERHDWTLEIHQKLRQVFKINMFRTNQEDAINATMAGKDVFVLMPTGGDQLPAICVMGETRGVTFVISPLISLINDQTRHLAKRGIPAIAYTGDMTAADKQLAHTELSQREPNTKVVYVTPEMMSKGGRIKGIIRDLIRNNRLARFVVDEAHCVSAWGHDFRDDYLKLDLLRKDYPNVPIMALTATAAEKVQADIKNVLSFKRDYVQIQQSFNRPNLYYEVRPKLKKVMNEIASFIAVQPPGASGIIYCSSREKCEVLAKELRDNHNIQAWHYHAGMSKGDRRKVQEGWQDHKFAVIVATIAFGMGIDKPDVRYVIHHSLPRSLEGYYQETGRAGRDGDPANCILFYGYGDSKSVMQLIDRDKDLNSQQKERQKNAMREVLRFCTNKTDCRRSQVLAFFNEEFDRDKCQQTCDVCANLDKSKIQVKDVTDAAKLVITMMKEFGSKDRITLLNAVDCFRGTNGNSDKGLGQNPHFGVGKDWDRTEAERLIQNLLLERALDEFHTTNGAGWNNTYLKLGKDASAFLKGHKKLSMDFREASPKKPRATKGSTARNSIEGQARLVPLAQRKKSSKTSRELSRKRSRQEVLEDGQDFVGSDDDPDWDPIDDVDGRDREDSGIQVLGRVSGSPPKRLRRSRAGAESASEQCLEGLRKLRAKKALQLPDETLQTIAAMMPSNMPALYEVEGLSRKQADLYGTKIFGVTTNFVQDHRAQEAPNAPAPTRRTLASNVATGRRIGVVASGVTLSNLNAYAYQGETGNAPTRRATAATGGRMALAQPGSSTGPRF